jgi:hypothetical protein
MIAAIVKAFPLTSVKVHFPRPESLKKVWDRRATISDP